MTAARTVVVGGGRMGTGIAHALLTAGAEVLLVDSTEELVGTALDRVRSMVASSEERGQLSGSAEAVCARLSGDMALDGAVGAALAIEAVPEDPVLKSRVLRDLEERVADNAVLATNTSSISVDELARTLAAPDRFLGMHFFNPVPASALVEIVRGAATADHVVTAAGEWTTLMGKTGIVVKDSPGFASSRLGVAIGLEAIRMVEEGVASVEDIDQAMVLGYKFPIGPLRLTDLVGLDVRLDIAEYLHQRLGARFEPPGLMRAMVSRGELGQKSGRGFYSWPD